MDLRSFKPEPNSIVLMTLKEPPSAAALEGMRRAVERWNRDHDLGVLMLTVPEGADLSQLDEKMMAKYGWVRAEGMA